MSRHLRLRRSFRPLNHCRLGPDIELEDVVDQGWEVGATPSEASGVMVGDDAVLEASLGLGPPPAPAGETVQRDPALTALLSAIRKDIDG